MCHLLGAPRCQRVQELQEHVLEVHNVYAANVVPVAITGMLCKGVGQAAQAATPCMGMVYFSLLCCRLLDSISTLP